MIEIKVPELGESMAEGTIYTWAFKEGEQVSEGDLLLEIETDKVNLEVSAEHDGVLKEIKKQAGETVQVGEVIALLEEGQVQEDMTAPSSARDEGQEEKGENQDKADRVSKEAEEINTSTNNDENTQEDQQIQNANKNPQETKETIASPAARRRAREKGIDLSEVQSKDPAGRVNVEDIHRSEDDNSEDEASKPKTSTERTSQNKSSGSTSARSTEKEATSSHSKPIERQRMSRRRQTIANRLMEAQHNAAMLTTFNEVDMSAIMDLRKRRKGEFKEKYNVNLGYMSFFAKAVVGALKAFPLLNAEIEGEDILIKKFYDIGVAVSAEEGLIVPVVRDVDRLSFAEIEKEILSLAEKARSNSLGLQDIQGGTFTITNGGIFGSLLSTPILNTPQVGILGMHKIQTRPVTVGEDDIENRPMMYIALSYDHRIVDGKDAVSFLVRVKELLEDPETLLIEGS
ncbi:2-oxoglutarate dehydrogenase complex dihydrolipoyllysine-residue succinyltransferase [Bacillus horti]|uniref:Dihydrolipoyllysine-residue succinyltransferase component of 2-oxoglutarate dehydrogenase complex n=1 Tax=Caldalkalibacillus horti TaxID=77523 RepID=A0ABT9W1C4_9BACI|nr:2-oxoglutarate dehydrogenase complex dihydrolipoyllysine-residue succinyltransferase [Bacillus horti]MDQ0167050.1 2-oxoglutarate dehydrogenase E2 component (dihydrolipoamide succinyltransferase) [Bacillus horti]